MKLAAVQQSRQRIPLQKISFPQSGPPASAHLTRFHPVLGAVRLFPDQYALTRELPFHARARAGAPCWPQSVHGRFLRLENFLPQNCATQRSAAQISLVKTSSAKQSAQHREKLYLEL